MEADYFCELMQNILDEELYRHSLGTAKAAASLANHYKADADKAYIAGLLHDYAKQYSLHQMFNKAEQLKLKLDPIIRREGKLLHAPLGAALIKAELDFDDHEILEAISYHTTGQLKMSLLGKVLYLADLIEENRQFDGIDKIRALAYLNLDQALLAAVNNTIFSVMSRGLILHPKSVAFRNSLIIKLNDLSGVINEFKKRR
jgi:predicted HD superfamily hydrolase involved in NAD metabolism